MDDLTEKLNVSTLRELAEERSKNEQLKKEIEYLDETVRELETENKKLKKENAYLKGQSDNYRKLKVEEIKILWDMIHKT